jgi:hypothetical protein
MDIQLSLDKSKLPLLLKKEGMKAYLQAIKNAQNKSINAAKKVSSEITREKYGLPRRGPKYGPADPYSKPSVDSVLTTSLVKSVGGIEAGISSKLFANKKRLSAIRFLSSERKPIKQKGIPRDKRTQVVGITLGHRTYISHKKFIQKDRGSRLHVWKSKETNRKWLMIRSTIASIASMLRHEKAKEKMTSAAEKRFVSALDSEIDKRLW